MSELLKMHFHFIFSSAVKREKEEMMEKNLNTFQREIPISVKALYTTYNYVNTVSTQIFHALLKTDYVRYWRNRIPPASSTQAVICTPLIYFSLQFFFRKGHGISRESHNNMEKE